MTDDDFQFFQFNCSYRNVQQAKSGNVGVPPEHGGMEGWAGCALLDVQYVDM